MFGGVVTARQALQSEVPKPEEEKPEGSRREGDGRFQSCPPGILWIGALSALLVQQGPRLTSPPSPPADCERRVFRDEDREANHYHWG